MLPEAHPYQLKVRDHFKQQDLGTTERIMTAVANHPDSKPVSLRTANLFFRYAQLWSDRQNYSADPSAPLPDDPIRTQALKLWLEQGDNAEPAITHLIEGPLELDNLDIFSQHTLRERTRAILRKHLQEFPTEPVLLFAREFFPDLNLEESDPLIPTSISEETAIPPLPPETGVSTKNYFSQLLLDLAQLSK